MREIKVRGIPYEWDQFIYGNYVEYKGSYFIYTEMYEKATHIEILSQVKVHPDTIGQFTGLKDKHGKEIYEGDIVRQNTDGKDFVVKWCDEEAGFNLYTLTDGVFQFGSVGWSNKIIGNIHENPEVLESTL
jgi:uncharacterized phage protein (TIGR01671 family)